MIITEIKNIKSGKRELRQFGLTVGIVFGLLAILFWWRGREHALYFFIASATLLFFGSLAPAVLKPIQKVWMSFAVVMGWFVTRLILLILFYIVVTPLGILAKVLGKAGLDSHCKTNTDTYWIAKEYVQGDNKRYENQF